MKYGTMIAAFALLALAVMAFLPQSSFAQSPYLDTFNTKYGTIATRLNSCRVCHTKVTPNLNPYGQAFFGAHTGTVTVGAALNAIRRADSDGDGFTNIVEIRALTFPGKAANHP